MEYGPTAAAPWSWEMMMLSFCHMPSAASCTTRNEPPVVSSALPTARS